MSIVTTTYVRLRGDGRERDVVDSMHACARADHTARTTNSLVAPDEAMYLIHHPLQRANGPKREPIAGGPCGGEERHDEPKGVEEREEDRGYHEETELVEEYELAREHEEAGTKRRDGASDDSAAHFADRK